MLYIVATPIGNLSDITLRALDTLRSVDYILCEDTRVSRKLLSHYEIRTPLQSLHKFSEAKKCGQVIEDLQCCKEIALISDAGTPLISDPGLKLIREVIHQNLPLTPIPGACSVITGLAASGLSSEPFQFIGFLPRKTNARKNALEGALNYKGTTITFESPHRIHKSLQALYELSPSTQIVIGRELTKKFETFLRGSVEEVLQSIEGKVLKGEIVLMIEP